MTWIEVEELVHRAQRGDRSAFDALALRFWGLVSAASLKYVRAGLEAQELTQEVFVHAWRKLPQLRDPRCFAGWLRRITARMAFNRLSRKAPFTGAEPDALDALACVTTDPLAEMVRAEDGVHVRAALADLKPMDRQALELFYLRGDSLKRIAKTLGVPVGTVKRRLHVARHRLKDVMDRGGRAARPRVHACV